MMPKMPLISESSENSIIVAYLASLDLHVWRYNTMLLKENIQRLMNWTCIPLAPLTATLTISSIVDAPSTLSFFFKESGKA